MKVYSQLTTRCFVVLLLFSCSLKAENSEKNKVDIIPSRSSSQERILKTNDIYIKELERLSSAIINGDKEELASFFEFPTANFLFVPRTPEVRKILENNNGKLDREAFINYCRLTSSNNPMSLHELFSKITITDLKINNKLFKNIEVKGDECYYVYQIYIQENNVVLSYGSDTNDKYKTEDCECSERTMFFYFKLVNERLKFSYSEAAG